MAGGEACPAVPIGATAPINGQRLSSRGEMSTASGAIETASAPRYHQMLPMAAVGVLTVVLVAIFDHRGSLDQFGVSNAGREDRSEPQTGGVCDR